MSTDDVLERYAEHVRGSPHNLLSPRGLAELESRHVPESRALARMLPDGLGRRLVDVGSGGGLPGLVIAAERPDLDVTLVEATTKKARWLEATAADLGLRVTVVNERVEGTHERLGRSFDLATARAVAPLERLVPWVVPLLRPGGALFAPKGERWRAELDAAGPQLRRHRAHVVATPDDEIGTDRGVDPPLRVVIIAA